MGDAAAFERRLHPDLAHRPFRREMAAVSVRSAVVHRSQREVRALHVQFCDATGGGRPDLKRSSIAADFPDLTWGTGSSTLRLYGPPVDACASSEVPPEAGTSGGGVGPGQAAVPANEHRIDVCKAVRRQSEASR